MSAHFLGLDLGGGSIKAVLIGTDGAIVARGSSRTPTTGGADAVIAEMVALGRSLLDGRVVAGVGVAVPGVVDAPAGEVLFLPNVHGEWLGRPAAREIAELIGAPTALLNDVRAATYGELHFGAGRGIRHFLMIAVGTGIGGGIVVDGELFMGSGGHAGEMGHQAIDLHGPGCACGGWGCVEAIAAGPALAAAARQIVEDGGQTSLAALVADAREIEPRHISQAAASGDQIAAELIERAGYRLGILASNAIILLNPQRVIVGGGVGLMGAPLLAAMRATIERRVGWYTRHAPVEVVAAELGEEAGALGAAAWGRRRAVD